MGLKKHGMYGTPEYYIWNAMLQRCTNPKHDHYDYYGGRGITVCERWRIFENFFKDMGMRPSPKHSIDRIDVNGNYQPFNCRWTTRSYQIINQTKRANTSSKYKGVSYARTHKSWAAGLTLDGKHFHVGRFKNEHEAAWMRDQWAVALHTEWTPLNFDYVEVEAQL
jgi:hypothetical protein